jgi:3D (Asp-Asp-Asp) domain-containing protein
MKASSYAIGMIVLVVLAVLPGCASAPKPPRGEKPIVREMEATGYCKCGKCCGWKRNWYLRPVIASGSSEGAPKKVGRTASGKKAKPGVIAADTRIYPFGTVMYVPGYGYGRVEDRGSAIKGEHIDLFFKSHKQALQWGRQTRTVKIWKP